MAALSSSLAAAIADCLSEAGDRTAIEAVRRVGGGDITQAARLETSQAAYFVKWHTNPPPRFFECEAKGLRLLGESGTVRVPEVVGWGKVAGEQSGFLVLGWIESGGGKDREAAARLGRELAHLHQQPQPFYGLDHDNYIGRLPQPNTRADSWMNFYRGRRLGAQRNLADRQGRLPAHRARLLDTLMANLDRWIDDDRCQPSLLHGDLWGGNWLVDHQGQPLVIDPAVYVGEREADLAMTALFGGFPDDFYRAYDEIFPLAAGYEERQPLYKLYYLLCHLNLFGESYGGSVDAILGQYAG